MKNPPSAESANERRGGRGVPSFEPSKWKGPFVLPDIREAIGLDSDEKVFLYDLASHANFTEESAEDRILQRNGFGRHIFERVRKSLSEKGLIEITHRNGYTNLYRLRVQELKRFPKASSRSRHPDAGASTAHDDDSIRTPADPRPRKLNRADLYTKRWPPIDGLSEAELRDLDAKRRSSWRAQTEWYKSEDDQDGGEDDDGTLRGSPSE